MPIRLSIAPLRTSCRTQRLGRRCGSAASRPKTYHPFPQARHRSGPPTLSASCRAALTAAAPCQRHAPRTGRSRSRTELGCSRETCEPSRRRPTQRPLPPRPTLLPRTAHLPPRSRTSATPSLPGSWDSWQAQVAGRASPSYDTRDPAHAPASTRAQASHCTQRGRPAARGSWRTLCSTRLAAWRCPLQPQSTRCGSSSSQTLRWTDAHRPPRKQPSPAPAGTPSPQPAPRPGRQAVARAGRRDAFWARPAPAPEGGGASPSEAQARPNNAGQRLAAAVWHRPLRSERTADGAGVRGAAPSVKRAGDRGAAGAQRHLFRRRKG